MKMGCSQVNGVHVCWRYTLMLLAAVNWWPVLHSACTLPPATYPLWDSIRAQIVEKGLLSQLQLEGVMYAALKHQTFLPSGQRELVC